MKKTLTSIVAAAMALFMAGCNKDITSERIHTISTVIGRTAGYACELSKTKTEVKEAVVKVLDIVSTVVPTNGQTFVEAWTPMIDAEIKKLIDARKLNELSAKAVKTALTIACEGIDYVFAKYPKAREGKDLVRAAVDGFVAGFKSVVTAKLSANEKPEIDEDAMKYFKSKIAVQAK
jgi:hypothetical protein